MFLQYLTGTSWSGTMTTPTDASRSHGIAKAVSTSLLRFLPIILLTASVGCGNGTGGITGTVLVGDSPLPAGRVTFFPQNNPGRTVGAHIQPDGTFEIPFCPKGPAIVTVQVLPAGHRSRGELMKNHGHRPGKVTADLPAVPTRYNDPETSDLQVTVRGGTQHFDFTLGS